MLDQQGIKGEIEFNKTISDIVWGDIPITELEYEIIQSLSFSRLKGVQQMGLMYIAFPDALHTRYKHSIGVMHVADQMLRSIQIVRFKNGNEYETRSLLGEVNKKNHLRQCFRIAALFHDLGHPPLSHVLEELFRKYPNLKDHGTLEPDLQVFLDKTFSSKKLYDHEAATQYLIAQPAFLVDIKDIIKEKLGDTAIEEILNILQKTSTPIYKILHTIIDSDLDADKIDYILRDSLYCNRKICFSLQDLFDNILLHENGTIFFVLPKGITAINSFLHARYQIIRDVQNFESRRIAVQMCIDAVYSWLGEKLAGRIRAEKIKEMHINDNYTDAKLFEEMRFSGKNDIIQALITGNLNYEQISSFSWWNFDPITRICLHSITFYPPSITELQNKLREITNNKEILLDIRQSKPPEFNVYVFHPDTTFPPVYSWSEITHGILCDSIRDLMVYIYSKKSSKNQIEITIEAIKKLAQECGISASTKRYEITKLLMGTDLIILTISAVYEWLSKNLNIFKYPEMWIYSQYHFLNFLKGITNNLEIETEYYIEPSIPSKISSIFFRDFEILRLAGLIKTREEIVSIPVKGSDIPLYKERFDFCHTPYGEEYTHFLISNSKSIQQIWKKIEDEVSVAQNRKKNILGEFAKTEIEAKVRRTEQISPELTEFKERRHRLRLDLFKAKVCLLVP